MTIKKDLNKKIKKITNKTKGAALKIKDSAQEQLEKINNSVSNSLDTIKDKNKK